jgi:hypothetical protein
MSGTFGYIWEPEVPGKYTITATFMGDDSYGSSWAETYVGVTEAAVTPQATTSAVSLDSINSTITTGLVAVGAAIIIAIAIAILLLRKRP